jgi:hypothetical protein
VDNLVNPQVYTIITFGASIFLWLFLPTVTIMSSMEGMPLYLIHPFFTLELFLMLSTAIVWVREMLISFYNLRKQRIALTKSMAQNSFIVSLAFVTVIVAISGCIVFSKTIHFEEFSSDLVDLISIPSPSPFALIYGYGILFCEGAWIIMGLTRALKRL